MFLLHIGKVETLIIFLLLYQQPHTERNKTDMPKQLSFMTQEEYNQLDTDFAHCAGTDCEKAGKCLRHTAYKMLAGNGNETYTVLNPAVIKGAQPCPFFEPDRKERIAWGISSIYNNVRAAGKIQLDICIPMLDIL